jgi:lipopolysaccharide/colanic/teichoic acid biosynthesis glycosyltransferase
VYKFRTLHEKFNNGNLLADEKRADALGLFLRNTHLDELPQLINILKGELSLIGPRPLLPDYTLYFNKTAIERERVKPGLTGLTQINGGNTLPWQTRFRYDAFYVRHLSFGLDFYIFFSTVGLFIRDFSKKHKKSAPFSVSYIE